MKKHLHYIALLLFLFIPTFVWSDTVPIQGDWTQGDLRSAGSIPFIVEKENNTLHILSRKHMENVLIQIVSFEGVVFYEERHTLLNNENISITLNNLPEGNYTIDFFHINGFLSGKFSNP